MGPKGISGDQTYRYSAAIFLLCIIDRAETYTCVLMCFIKDLVLGNAFK